jgi:hypothetical protein
MKRGISSEAKGKRPPAAQVSRRRHAGLLRAAPHAVRRPPSGLAFLIFPAHPHLSCQGPATIVDNRKRQAGRFELFVIGKGPDFNDTAGAYLKMHGSDGVLLYDSSAASGKTANNFDTIAAAAVQLTAAKFSVK